MRGVTRIPFCGMMLTARVCRARWLNWRANVLVMLVLLLVVLPYYHCYRILASTSEA